jgi:hypothetical protein
MFLGAVATYVLTAGLLVAFALRAKNLGVSDGQRYDEDMEQMHAIRPRGPGGIRPRPQSCPMRWLVRSRPQRLH